MADLHASIAPDSKSPLVAVIDIDKPQSMKGELIISQPEPTDAPVTIATWNLTVENGTIEHEFPDVNDDPEVGEFKIKFKDSDEIESPPVIGLPPKAKDFMQVKLNLQLNDTENNKSFSSPIPKVFLHRITDEHAISLAKVKFTKVPIDLKDKTQFKREPIPLPEPGENVKLAECVTDFSADALKGYKSSLNKKESFVSDDLMEKGSESEKNRVQNHEQGHMNVAVALIEYANIALEISSTGKSGEKRKAARNKALPDITKFISKNLQVLHDLYDSETKNGNIADVQKDWDDNFIQKTGDFWVDNSGPVFEVS